MNLTVAMVAGIAFGLGIGQKEAAPATYTPTAAYARRDMEGFVVRVNPQALSHAEETGAALELMREKLKEINRIVPRRQAAVLRSVPIWVEWRTRPNGAAEYHPDVGWLRENGYNPEKAKCVEINNVVNFVDWTKRTQPMMLLHELAHAYHDRVLGMDNAEVQQAYDTAVKSGRYDSVEFVTGGKRRHYALTDAKEYFAELTETWFGRNDFYPFVRAELRTHDPAGYALMAKVWSGDRADGSREHGS